MNVAKSLIAFRKRHLLTQEEAARKVGVPVASLRNWEQERYEPRHPELLINWLSILDKAWHRK